MGEKIYNILYSYAWQYAKNANAPAKLSCYLPGSFIYGISKVDNPFAICHLTHRTLDIHTGYYYYRLPTN